MADLFAMASRNGPRLETRFAEIGADQSVRSFAEFVEREGQVSINMRPMPLISFLTFKRHQNMYEWAEERASESGRPREEILRERLGKYYERRIAFDRAFVNGEDFRYGALNAGGPGIRQYGNYCVILSTGGHGEATAYLKGDSLQSYLTPAGSIDEDLLQSDISPHSHRHMFAGLKHATALVTCGTPLAVPAMLCI